MNLPVLLALVALSAPAQDDSTGGQTRRVELDPANPSVIHTVIAKPQVRTAIQLPEPWASTPQCGDCALNDEPAGSHLWRLIDSDRGINTVYISPTRLPGPDLPESAFETNLLFILASGVPVTIAVKLDHEQTSDWRVIFTLPKSKTAVGCMERAKAELEGEFEKRVERAAEDRGLKSLVHGTRCREFAGGPRRDDRMVLRARQMCRNDSFTYLVVEVQNRGREDLRVGEFILVNAEGVESTRVFVEKRALQFNEKTNAVVIFPLEAPSQPLGTYGLTVFEAGGSERKVEIAGLSVRDSWFFGWF